jgi:hypothetical protein
MAKEFELMKIALHEEQQRHELTERKLRKLRDFAFAYLQNSQCDDTESGKKSRKMLKQMVDELKQVEVLELPFHHD